MVERVWGVVVVLRVPGIVVVERGAGRAGCYYCIDGLVEGCEAGRAGGMEERDYGGAGEEMGVGEVSPGADGEGSAGVLRLNRVCIT